LLFPGCWVLLSDFCPHCSCLQYLLAKSPDGWNIIEKSTWNSHLICKFFYSEIHV
jgi:hypothetical protein